MVHFIDFLIKCSPIVVLELISLMYFAKNFIIYLLAKYGISLRDYPFETIKEKEFHQIDQQLINSALDHGLLEILGI